MVIQNRHASSDDQTDMYDFLFRHFLTKIIVVVKIADHIYPWAETVKAYQPIRCFILWVGIIFNNYSDYRCWPVLRPGYTVYHFHRPLLLCCMDPTALLSAALLSVTLLSDGKNLRRLALCAFVAIISHCVITIDLSQWMFWWII